MDRKERKRLVKRLNERYEFLQYYKSDDIYIKKDGKIVFTFDVEYLTDDEQYQLRALQQLIEEHKDLSDADIKAVIKANKKKFPFLLFCIKKYKDFISMFKKRGGMVYLKSKIIGDRRIEEFSKYKLL